MRPILICMLAIAAAACNEKQKNSSANISQKQKTDSVTGVFPSDTVEKKEAAPTAAINDTIIPGKSIAHIRLDEKTTDLIKDLGEPDSSDAAMGKALLSWFSKPKAGDTMVNSVRVFTKTNFGGKDEAARVKLIRVTSPFFKTDKNVSTGSTLAFIKLQYPTIKKWAGYEDSKGYPVIIYTDMKEGISFEVSSNTKCVGIAVHRPNETAWEIYNAVFGNVEKL